MQQQLPFADAGVGFRLAQWRSFEAMHVLRRAGPRLRRNLVCYNPRMTFMQVTYELQSPLKNEQLRSLAEFANTYGLQRFYLDEQRNLLHFEYDASRLEETVVEHVLREARIPVLRRVEAV